MVRPAIEEMMRKERIGAAAHLALASLSFVYGAGVRLRYGLYQAGVLRRKRLDCPVISIGNITVGGTGKTPMTIFLASYLKKRGMRPVILSRGYKKTGPGGIVSDGRTLGLGPAEAGDEPYLMARRLPDVPVIVGADRFGAGLLAVERFRPDCAILDDGFQHMRLERDIDILLMDPARGLGNGYLLPRGILREPAGAMRRANLVMVKGGELRGPEARLAERWQIPAVRFDYRASGLYGVLDGVEMGVDFLRGRKAAAFAGIADPESFFKTLQGLGATLTKTFSFPDHHEYTGADIATIMKAKDAGADIYVTTEKDGVKLKGLLMKDAPRVFALGVEVEVKDEAALNGLLAPIIKRVKGA